MTLLIALIALAAVVLAAARLVHTIRLDGYGRLPAPRSRHDDGSPAPVHRGPGHPY